MAANPSGAGPPTQSCQAFKGPGGTDAPGRRRLARLSVRRTQLGGPTGGTGGSAYNNAGAPSQYDVACFQVEQPPP